MARRWGLGLMLVAMAAVVVTTVTTGLGDDPAGAIIRRRTITPEVDTGLRIQTDGRQSR